MKSLKNIFFISFLLFFTATFSQEKIISAIEITGAKKTNISFLKSLLDTKKGAVLDSIVLNEDITLLKRLPAISHAYYKITHTNGKFYKVLITVEENFTIIPTVNIWTTTHKKFAYKIGLYDYNLFGRNIAFGGFYQNNGFNSYGINFRAPNLFSKKWGLALNHQNWKSEEPLYFENKTANYLYNNVSYEILGLFQINLRNKIKFGVNFFNEKYSYLSGEVATTVPKFLDINKKLFKTVYEYDNLDFYYQYISGFKSVFYGQYVISNNASQDDFLIAWNDFFYYKRVGKKGNWANRLRAGLSTNNKTPFAPFALDNNVNIRGVGILVDRGTGSIVLNSEFRYTFFDKKWLAIQSNAFVDAGSWRHPGGELNDFIENKNIKIYSGVGLRFISKKIYNATFRIDYGFSLKDNTHGLVFGIGQYF